MLVKFGILQGAEPYVINYQAYFITVILMFIYIQSKTKSKLRHNPKDIPKIVLLGILGSGIGSFIGYTGLKFSDVTNYAFIIRSIVAFAVIFGYFFLKEKLTKTKIMFVFTLLLGAYFISTGGQTITPHFGDVLILCAAALYALVNVFSKKLLKRNSSQHLVLFRSLGGAPVLLIMSFLLGYDILQREFILLSTLDGIVLFIQLFFLYKTLEIKSVSYLSMMASMFTIMVVIFSYMFFNEVMNLFQIIGGVIIILSIIFIEKSKI